VVIEEGDLKVTVRKTAAAGGPASPAPAGAAAHGGSAAPSGSAGLEADEANGYHVVRSPMVATFYRASSPSSPSFVELGDRVGVGQTLCILEAMKLMNEFGSEVAGIVRRINVEDGSAVEYGQPLFEIEPE
jgi:acetyl-CoA carboxylase biotin carboxyl carrier protein